MPPSTATWMPDLVSEDGKCQSDVCEVCVGERMFFTKKVVVNAGEAKKGGLILREAPQGTTVLILELGADAAKQRARISDGKITGWISMSISSCRPLGIFRPTYDHPTVKLQDFEGFDVETLNIVTLRKYEDRLSEWLLDLPIGSRVEILQMGTNDTRRAEVVSCSLKGWISVSTPQGEPLVGKQGKYTLKTRVYGDNSSQAVLEFARAGDLKSLRTLTASQTGCLGSLLASPVHLRCYDELGRTPLMMASTYGHQAVVDYVLRMDPLQVELLDRESKQTALHHLISRQTHGERTWLPTMYIARLLLEAKADIDARDILYRTPLMLAAAFGDSFAAEVLLEGKADVNAKDAFIQTPLDFAVHLHNGFTANLLAAAGGAAGQAGPVMRKEKMKTVKSCPDAYDESLGVSSKEKAAVERALAQWPAFVAR